jgi:hypothetical protein
MPGKSTLTADAAEQAALRDLSKSEQRGEADRARAIRLTLEGKAEEIAAVLGVHVSTVRNWRGYFAHGGVAGLRQRPRPGSAVRGRAARRGDRRVDPERGCAPRWRLDAGAPVCRDRPARRAGDLAAVALAPTAPKGFAWRRPRHTLKGRQDTVAVEASRQRLLDLKTQVTAGAIDLMFLDESEALTHPYLARCWARRGTELRIEAPGQAKKRAMLGAFDPVHRHLLVHTSATKRSTDFLALLDQLGAACGTTERTRPLVAVLDNGPIHRSKLTTRALAERTWLTVEWLPQYAPELNDIERCWRDLKQHYVANRTPACAGAGSSPMPTLSNAPSLTLSPASTASANPNHRPLSYRLLRYLWSPLSFATSQIDAVQGRA